MDDDAKLVASGLLIAVMAALIFWGGWQSAHGEVARECKLQGSFYVGKTVYNCGPSDERGE